MSRMNQVQGNLALANEVYQPGFTVLDGGLSNALPFNEDARSPQKMLAKGHSFKQMAMVAVLSVCLAVMSVFLISGELAFRNALTQTELASIEVHDGDSLWSIASRYPVDGLSTQETVDAMMNWNGLGSAGLVPGQVLLVAAP